MTRLGVVGPLTSYADVLAAGCDYLEPTIVGSFVAADDPWEALPVAPEGRFPSWAILFPSGMRLADPAFPRDRLEDYLTRVANALAPYADADAKVVLGSGGARTVPDHLDRQVAEDTLAEVIALTRDTFAQRGIEMLLEPLRRAESNIFNDIPESLAYLDAHGLADVRVVADCFHLFSEGGEIATVVRHLDRVGHVHLAGVDRRPVTDPTWPVAEYVRALVAAGYDGPMSFECSWTDLRTEVAESVAFVREALASAT